MIGEFAPAGVRFRNFSPSRSRRPWRLGHGAATACQHCNGLISPQCRCGDRRDVTSSIRPVAAVGIAAQAHRSMKYSRRCLRALLAGRPDGSKTLRPIRIDRQEVPVLETRRSLHALSHARIFGAVRGLRSGHPAARQARERREDLVGLRHCRLDRFRLMQQAAAIAMAGDTGFPSSLGSRFSSGARPRRIVARCK